MRVLIDGVVGGSAGVGLAGTGCTPNMQVNVAQVLTLLRPYSRAQTVAKL